MSSGSVGIRCSGVILRSSVLKNLAPTAPIGATGEIRCTLDPFDFAQAADRFTKRSNW